MAAPTNQDSQYMGSADLPARGQLGRANGTTVDDIAFVVFDSNGMIWLANQVAANGLGMAVSDLIGSPLAELTLHPDVAEQNMSYLCNGRFDAYQIPSVVVRPDGSNVAGVGIGRAVEVDGKRGGIGFFVPDTRVGRLGPLQQWIDLVPIAVGLARPNWIISAVSREVSELIGRTPAECIGLSLLGLVHPDDVALLSGPERLSIDSPVLQPLVRFVSREGESVQVSVLLAPSTSIASRHPDDTSSIVFALVGRIEDFFPGPLNRLAALELRLRRIGAEIKAAGLLDSMDTVPAVDEFPQLRELTSRQSEILNRLLEGQRVPMIAEELFISRSTVRNHLAMIFKRFGVHSQAGLLSALHRKPQSENQVV